MTRLWPQGEAIEVWGDPETPQGFRWRGAPHHIEEVCNRWRVHTHWWEPAQVLWREYLKVATDSGYLCLIYRDRIDGGWFLSRLYD